MNLTALDNTVFTVVLIVLSILFLFCLFKAVAGPSVADRLMCVNMMGTIVIVMIGILAVMLCEGYLADISIIYAMISFLSVVVFCKIYMGVYLEKRDKEEKGSDD